MSVMKALEKPETIYTRDGKKRVTHEAYSYHITPYQNPPVKLEVVKGFIDHHGQFLAVHATVKVVDITPTEFRELISPTPQGKPAGDFRLSDVLGMLKRRTAAPAQAAARELAAATELAAAAEASQANETKPAEAAPDAKEPSAEEAPKEAAAAAA